MEQALSMVKFFILKEMNKTNLSALIIRIQYLNLLFWNLKNMIKNMENS